MDKKHGYGVYAWADGRRYHGTWKDGKQHGQGLYELPDGKRRKGEWVDGTRVKWTSTPKLNGEEF